MKTFLLVACLTAFGALGTSAQTLPQCWPCDEKPAPPAPPAPPPVECLPCPGNPGCKCETPAYRASVFALRSAIMADAVTTEIALRRPGIYESNPLQQYMAFRIGSHAALAYFLPKVEGRFLRRHERIGTALNFALATGFSVIAAHNMGIRAQ